MVSEVHSLYRAILRLGARQLKLTDQHYFRKLVREEFKRHSKETHSEELDFQIRVSGTWLPTQVVQFV